MNTPLSPLPSELLEPLLALAEGRIDPEAWLAWWDENAPRVEAAVSRGAFLRLRPLSDRSVGPNYSVAPVQPGAQKLLAQLKIPFTPSDRYAAAGKDEFDAWCAARRAREAARKREFQPHLKRLEADFPRFVKFLRSHLDRIVGMTAGASEHELSQIEQRLETPLPLAYRRWLAAVSGLDLETLQFGEEHPFRVEGRVASDPAHGLICIADFALEADGDLVLLDARLAGDDPPVIYYAHGVPEARPLAPSFTAWIESLPKSPALRDD